MIDGMNHHGVMQKPMNKMRILQTINPIMLNPPIFKS